MRPRRVGFGLRAERSVLFSLSMEISLESLVNEVVRLGLEFDGSEVSLSGVWLLSRRELAAGAGEWSMFFSLRCLLCGGPSLKMWTVSVAEETQRRVEVVLKDML